MVAKSGLVNTQLPTDGVTEMSLNAADGSNAASRGGERDNTQLVSKHNPQLDIVARIYYTSCQQNTAEG